MQLPNDLMNEGLRAEVLAQEVGFGLLHGGKSSRVVVIICGTITQSQEVSWNKYMKDCGLNCNGLA